jgi:hypothetical protein
MCAASATTVGVYEATAWTSKLALCSIGMVFDPP